MFKFLLRSAFSFLNFLALLLSITFFCCSAITVAQTQPTNNQQPQTAAASAPKADSPIGTVQEFYKAMRERRFRDALLMTNLRPAVEKLTPAELADLSPDFEPMATRVPAKVDLSGEQISGNLASVYVKANDPLTNELKLDEIKLRRENNNWTVLTGDAETEAAVKREGANYFFKLRLETRHADIELTMQDIIKAQLAYSIQHKNEYTDFQTLTNERLLPADMINPDVMGYRFRLQLSADKKKYAVNAEPVQYGKTGKLSFLLTSGDGKTGPKIQKDDKSGAALSSKN